MDNFGVDVEILNGEPRFVTFNIITLYDSNQVLAADFARAIKVYIVTLVLNYNPTWTAEIAVRNVRGWLLARSQEGGNSLRIGRLNQITGNMILEMYELAQQSNLDLQLEDLNFTFTFEPGSIRLGGARRVVAPSWAKKVVYRKTWQGYDDVNCAALAICFIMYSVTKNYSRNFQLAINDAKSLMVELAWEIEITLNQLEKFVQVYTEKQLIVLLPSGGDKPIIFTGKSYDGLEKSCVFLIYDPIQKHFAACNSVKEFLKSTRGSHARWCHTCIVMYRTSSDHVCEDGQVKKRGKVYAQPCLNCGIVGRHECSFIGCRSCNEIYGKKDPPHRCIVYKKNSPSKTFLQPGEEPTGKTTALWVYDFESRIQIVPTVKRNISQFLTDDDGYYLERRLGEELDDEAICFYEFSTQKHEVNLVVLRNVFTDQQLVYFGDGALTDFILFITNFNRGNNICLAHNASGYDTRLLFDACTRLNQKIAMAPLMRGGKFMQLIINKNTIFRDSMLHVRGSLKSLAKDFCDGIMEKGYFPHLFNSIENYNYSGRLPDKKYFDLSFMLKSEKDLQDFNNWYDSWQGEWNFMEQLELYCKNDVLVLQHIAKKYHEIAQESFGRSPWFNATAPSYVHEVFITKLGENLELPVFKEKPEEYKSMIQNLARKEYWAVLKPSEYWFARNALRGGRTDIRKISHRVEDQDWEKGIRIRYQDICSQYPYQQVVHDFPVGLPTIHVYDYNYYPCGVHMNNQNSKCDCRVKTFVPGLKIVEGVPPPTAQEIIDKDLFGIFCATVDPPKDIYHPVLVAFDETMQKSIAGCNRMVEQFFTSVEFITALKNGYKIVKLFRFDEYHRKPSLWKDIIQDLFIEKMYSSGAEPSLEKQVELYEDYKKKFGVEFAEKIKDTFGKEKWGKRPAHKQTAKIRMNSAWGKHAQRAIMEQQVIFSVKNQENDIFDFFQNCVNSNYDYKEGVALGDNMVMYKYAANGATVTPDLHGGYLPAALFVPAYGRLQLWEQLNKLGKRVLMNDTDSIIYLYDPEQYNIPQGGLLGEWEVEDIDTCHGGIDSFVGLGPKTYGISCKDGFEMVKAKGVSLNRATSNIVNFESMKTIAESFLGNCFEMFGDDHVRMRPKVLKVPQKTFDWSVKHGMTTRMLIKDLKFNDGDVKGFLDEEGFLYPFGYEKE